MKAPPSKSKPRHLCPSGSHVARLVWLIDLGTQKYQDDLNRKVLLGFETPEAKAVFNDEKGLEPFMLKRQFAFMLVSKNKTKLRLFIESWRGRPFTDDNEAAAFDFSVMLGKPALLTVTRGISKKDGSPVADLAGIEMLPKDRSCPPAVNVPVEYSIEERDGGCFKSLPEWLRKVIMDSQEWKQPASAPAEEPAVETGDDVPF